MNTLLKDMPEHMERIEDNWSLKGAIEDILSTEASMCLTDNIFNIESEDVPQPRSKGDNLSYIAEIDNKSDLAELIIKELTQFVNQNYEWKGVKS